MSGVQAAGFLNLSSTTKGVQLAGFMNGTKDSAGVQAAGFINIAKQVKTQVAGFVNVAEVVNGAQLAGFINVAGKVKGVQVAGFINTADSSDYPIGLINIVRSGEMGIGISVDESLTSLATFRSGGRRMYGVLGAGINVKTERIRYALEAGLGVHVAITKSFRINVEGTEMTLTDFRRGSYLRSTIRIMPAVKLGKNLELFGGPSFNTVVITKNAGRDLVKNYTWENRGRTYFTGMYFGGVVGLQCLL
jgi:hypothetical protein